MGKFEQFTDAELKEIRKALEIWRPSDLLLEVLEELGDRFNREQEDEPIPESIPRRAEF